MLYLCVAFVPITHIVAVGIVPTYIGVEFWGRVYTLVAYMGIHRIAVVHFSLLVMGNV